MPSPNLPLILLVPGAFGTPESFSNLLPHLKEAGYETHPGPYASSNPSDPSGVTCANDIASLRDGVLLPLLDTKQRDVVILAHSHGAIVASAGNIGLDDESLGEASGGVYPPFIKLDKPSKGLALIEPAEEVLYSDCDPAHASELSRGLVPHACAAFETKSTAPAWADKGFDGRRTYIRTLNDCCNPAPVQDLWRERTAVHWDVTELKTGHMPFISQPKVLAEEIVKFIEGLHCDEVEWYVGFRVV